MGTGSPPAMTMTPDLPVPVDLPPADASKGFKCDRAAARPGPRRIWRLTARQYLATVSTILDQARPSNGATPEGSGGVPAPFTYVSAADRFSNMALSYTMSTDELSQAYDAAEQVATLLVGKLRSTTARFPTCLATGKMPFADCFRSLLPGLGELIFRRPLTSDEVGYYTGLAANNVTLLGGEEGAAVTALQAMLVSPSFLYRTELGAGAPDASGQIALTPFEVASAISYALTDAPPDATLWKAAQDNALSSPEQVTAQINRLLSYKSKNAAARFLAEYFKINNALLVFKDPKLFPEYHAEGEIRDAKKLIDDLLANSLSKNFFGSLLTTRNGFMADDTSGVNGRDGKRNPNVVPITFMPTERAGLLTQPAFLAAFSAADHNGTVQRGRFIRESLLCRAIPQVNIDQIPELPPAPTMRERLKAHSANPTCAACHHLMDSLGLAFESYAHTGRYLGPSGVDVSGVISDLDGPDVAFTGPTDLADKLATLPAVTRCMTRMTFRNFLGRNEQDGRDDCVLADALGAYEKTGGDFGALLATLMSSRAFTHRSMN